MEYTNEITFYDDRYVVENEIKVNAGMEVDINFHNGRVRCRLEGINIEGDK